MPCAWDEEDGAEERDSEEPTECGDFGLHTGYLLG